MQASQACKAQNEDFVVVAAVQRLVCDCAFTFMFWLCFALGNLTVQRTWRRQTCLNV